MLTLALAFTLLPGGDWAPAAEFRSGESVVIGAKETIKDDLYVAGQKIVIDGIIEGDLIALGQDITINGEVKGDIIAAAQSIEAIGTLGDDVRIAGQALKIASTAKISGDVVAAGMSLECEPSSTVGGDMIYAGYQGLFGGEIEQDLLAAMSSCWLKGNIGGNVELNVDGDESAPSASAMAGGNPPRVSMPNVPGGLTVADSAVIDGKFKYTSRREAKVDPAAKIAGRTEHLIPEVKPGEAPRVPTLVDKSLVRARHLACVLLVGLGSLLVLPRWTSAWAENIRTRPLASFLGGIAGMVGFIVFLIAALVIMIVLAVLFGSATLDELVPLVVVGGIVSYGVVIFGFVLFATFLSEALVGLAIGRFAVSQAGLVPRLLALIVGTLLVVLILSIPYVGGMIGFVVFLLGMGGYLTWLAGFGSVAEPDVVATADVPRKS